MVHVCRQGLLMEDTPSNISPEIGLPKSALRSSGKFRPEVPGINSAELIVI